MTLLAASLILAMAIAAPASAQVINGETPLDETMLNRETPGPAHQASTPTSPSSPAAGAPAQGTAPQSTPRND